MGTSTHPLTEQLEAALAECEASVERCLAVAALLPGEVSATERMELATVALEEAQAAEEVVAALMPLVQAQKPRGAFAALERAEERAQARLEATIGRVLFAATDAELRAADRATGAAWQAVILAGERFGAVCQWRTEAIIEMRLGQKEAA